MTYELVVVQPFAGYARGAVIADPAEVTKVLCENPHSVVQRPAPEPAPAKGK